MSLFLYAGVAESKCLAHFLSLYSHHFSVLYWHNCAITVPHTILPKHSINTKTIQLGMKMKTGMSENENTDIHKQTYH